MSSDWRGLQKWLRVGPDAKPLVYRQVFETAEISSLSYWLQIFFSAGIATFGLVENSPAVIIGAMLISPLMGPIMATGMALAVGDVYLGIKAILNLLASVTASVAFSGLLVWLLPFHSETGEILSRTNPNLLDLGIALFSGLAGSVVVCRGGGEGATALPGVAIAVALMPPLCTIGFGLGAGLNLEIMGGAGLLFLTNLVAIVASAFVVFLLVGMNTSEVRDAMQVSQTNERLARVLAHGPVARVMTAGGQLRWRVLMILILLSSIAVPLHRALLQVANETFTRGAVQDELKHLVPATAIVSQQVSLGRDMIAIRLISTRAVPEAKIDQFQKKLSRRTGHEVQLTVEAVARESDLADLMDRLNRPPAPPPPVKEKTIAEMQKDLVDQVGAAIGEIWPADAPMQDFQVASAPDGTTVGVRYQAKQDLGKMALGILQQSLRNKLAIADLILTTERTAPAVPASSAKKP